MISSHDPKFQALIAYLCRVPAVEHDDSPSRGFGSGESANGWWIKFTIGVDHKLAWNAIQELAYVLNYLSLDERLPSVFKPVSPPPYLNGGPREYLSWVIECASSATPDFLTEWLEGRLPQPVDDLSQWLDSSNTDIDRRAIESVRKQCRVISVKAVRYPVLHVVFNDGFAGEYDLSDLIAHGPMFAPLKDPEYFKQVAVAPYGHSFGWNLDAIGDEIDFCVDSVRSDIESKLVERIADADVSRTE
jgi:hypothetical protein